jgi:hypothetical protein
MVYSYVFFAVRTEFGNHLDERLLQSVKEYLITFHYESNADFHSNFVCNLQAVPNL